MKTIILITFFLLFWGNTKAQTVIESPDHSKLSYVISENTSKKEIRNARNEFSKYGIESNIKVKTKKGKIVVILIEINSAQGKVRYMTDNPIVLGKGVKIFVNKGRTGEAAISVGPNAE